MIKILKFGGSILKNYQDLLNVAKIISNDHNKQVIIVSAFYQKTSKLEKDIMSLNKDVSNKIKDSLLVIGELETASLLGALIEKENREVAIFNAFQLPIVTNNTFGNSDVLSINISKVNKALKKNQIVIIPGFQGITIDKDWTTLGKEGSDLTALMIAYSLKQTTKEEINCHLFKDVKGIYEYDPNQNSNSEFYHQIEVDKLISILETGANVVSLKAAIFAKENNINFSVGNNIDNCTLVISN